MNYPYSDPLAEFFAYRRAWLVDPDGIQVRRQPDGEGWQVVARLDGNYPRRVDAERIAEAFRLYLGSALEGTRKRDEDDPERSDPRGSDAPAKGTADD